jgi:hypothetical protein
MSCYGDSFIFLYVDYVRRDPLSPFESKWGATWKKSSGSDLENGD